MLYEKLLRPILFRLFDDPETAHEKVSGMLEWLCRHPRLLERATDRFAVRDSRLHQTLLGMWFPNPLGLAAGMNKTGTAIDAWNAFGFGFQEIGCVVPLAQPGNARPRIKRLVDERALINSMGFNSPGAAAVAQNISTGRLNTWQPLGANIGKNKETPNQRAVEDYVKVTAALARLVDFFVINVSSPNTPNLRDLQDKVLLKEIVLAVQETLQGVSDRRPVLVKVSPDLANNVFDDIATVVTGTNAAGVVATNTTIDHDGYLEAPKAKGGRSGPLLKKRSLEVVTILRKLLPFHLIIGVGGIETGRDAATFIRAGADLVQVYTSFVYGGPNTPRNILRDLLEIMTVEGWTMQTRRREASTLLP